MRRLTLLVALLLFGAGFAPGPATAATPDGGRALVSVTMKVPDVKTKRGCRNPRWTLRIRVPDWAEYSRWEMKAEVWDPNYRTYDVIEDSGYDAGDHQGKILTLCHSLDKAGRYRVNGYVEFIDSRMQPKYFHDTFVFRKVPRG